MNFSVKKIFLGGFVAFLLVSIPLTIFLLQKQQEVRSRAEKSTNLSFAPDSSQTNPIQKNVGDTIPLDITVNPGKNLVSFVKLEIQYDPDKLATASANAFQANTVAFPHVMEGPIYSPGKIAITLDVGPDPTKAIQTTVKAATVTFKALANTSPGTPTLVTYGATTQVLSIGSTDQASENVLSAAAPAAIVIGGPPPSISGPTEPIPSGSPTPTVPVDTATPTVPVNTATPTVPVDTTTPTLSESPSPTASGGGGTGGGNVAPVCNSLSLDRASSGNAPFSITFTANGSDSDGTVSKVSINFGDGNVSDVTQAGGIGTNSVNVQVAHTYNNEGTYQASAILTDSNNAVSNSANCKQTITVTSGSGGTGGGTSPTTIVAGGSTTPTMAATGTTSTALGIGAAALFLVIAGGFLFFIL